MIAADQRRVPDAVSWHASLHLAVSTAADGSAAVVVTYVNLAVFPRVAGETWAEAFARPPIHLPAHELPQAEAVCFARDGSTIFVASEETRKLLRYDRAK